MYKEICLILLTVFTSFLVVGCTADNVAIPSNSAASEDITDIEDKGSSIAHETEPDSIAEPVDDLPPLPVILAAEADEDISDRFPDDVFRKFIIESILERAAEEPYPIYGRDLSVISNVILADFMGDEDWAYREEGVLYKISSMEGIHYFERLQILRCTHNLLTELDLRGNNELIELSCITNNINKLYLGNNDRLIKLYCNNNALSSLDLSRCTELEVLSCGSNQLTRLDLKHNLQLADLSCGSNPLEGLDLSANINLEKLSCGNSGMTVLDVSTCINLVQLHCSANDLTELDVSALTDLEDLYCSGNWLTSIDISNNRGLTRLMTSCNLLEQIDLSNNPDIYWLELCRNNITELDLNNIANLKFVSTDEDVEVYNLDYEVSWSYTCPYEWDQDKYPQQ